MQEARHGDKAALNAQCEPLLTVAEAHADGKESFARSIATELYSDFLSVEERFAANKEATEQEVIDSLRQVGTQLHALALREGSGKLLRSLLPGWRLSSRAHRLPCLCVVLSLSRKLWRPSPGLGV